MARVVFTGDLIRQFGTSELTVPARSIKALIQALSQQCPEAADTLMEMAISIDGEIHQQAFLEKLSEEAEVCFIPPIGAG
ncbi:MAG: MoaD/ThiS family protein [Gammaproteobacteria bacterium]|nr:MoaD/ThiS family protein [Gammaproteobacteria bacterium]